MRTVGKVLYGSQNLNLAGENSDKDYKIFIAPEFNDLYFMRKVSHSDLPYGYDSEHYSVMDIRKYDSLLRKGNINCIEYLFSTEFILYDKRFEEYLKIARSSYEEGFVKLVWKDFFSSLEGIVLETIKRSPINDKKAQSRAIFFKNFLIGVINNDFHITEQLWRSKEISIPARNARYNNDTSDFHSLEEWKEILETIAAQVDYKNFSIFIQQGYNNNMMATMKNIIANDIREELSNA